MLRVIKGFKVSIYQNNFIRNCSSIKPSDSWIEHKLIPGSIKPYLHLARLDKQVGTMLLMWPCFWSASLAAPIGTLPDIILLSKFAIGALIMRGAGCTINDLWDKDFDKHVERTKSRPLARGDISVKQALLFLSAQLTCGLGVLLTLNAESIILGMMSMPLVIAYPLMKRVTNWPQLILGLTFNWGALVGWTAATNNIIINNSVIESVTATVLSLPFVDMPSTVMSLTDQALPLYAAGVCWTLVYDTLYGYQDRKDDAMIGLKSTALYLGDRPQIPLTILSFGMLGGLLMSGHAAGLTLPFYCGATAMWSQVMWQIWTADINNPKNIWTRFNSNKYSGGLLTAAIIAGHF